MGTVRSPRAQVLDVVLPVGNLGKLWETSGNFGKLWEALGTVRSPRAQVLDVVLPHGSLLTMSVGMQASHTHEVKSPAVAHCWVGAARRVLRVP